MVQPSLYIFLRPVSITKLKYIVLHYKSKGFHECINGDQLEAVFMSDNTLSNCLEGLVDIFVGVNYCNASLEESTVERESTRIKVIFEIF